MRIMTLLGHLFLKDLFTPFDGLLEPTAQTTNGWPKIKTIILPVPNKPNALHK